MAASNAHSGLLVTQRGSQRVNPEKSPNSQRKWHGKKKKALEKKDNRKNTNGSSQSNATSTTEQSLESHLNIFNQSLTELLATGGVTLTATSSPSRSDSPTKETLKKKIGELQTCVNDLTKQNSSLQNQIDLLQSELDDAKKSEQKLKKWSETNHKRKW